ncbi:fibronectin type III domain-containing protein [Pedobacter sp. NJ-S-72]
MKTKLASTALYVNILVCILLISWRQQATAQVITNYAVTNTAGTFTALSGATTPGLTTGTTDDGTISAIPIGFDFWYMGTRYTTISSSTNGWLTFGSTIQDNYTNNLSGSGTRPVIAPLWDDLNTVSASNVTYKTTGTTGSRIFTIQYLNIKWNYQNLGSTISFQVNLYESTGRVEFIYRPEISIATLTSASIGISATATGSGNFLSINNAGTGVSSTAEQNVISKPASGTTYRFTPPIPIAPTGLTFTSVSGTSMTLNWTDNSTNETGFVIYRSTDGINYTFVSQTAAAAITSVQSGLTAGTTYYWRVFAVTEGGLSTALSGSNIAACTGPNISQLPATSLISYYKFEGNASDATGNNNGLLQGSPVPLQQQTALTT